MRLFQGLWVRLIASVVVGIFRMKREAFRSKRKRSNGVSARTSEMASTLHAGPPLSSDKTNTKDR
jgi:hypothetical protein